MCLRAHFTLTPLMDHLPQREKFVNTKSRCRTLCYLEAAILLVLGLAAAHAAPTLNPKKYTAWSDYAEARSPCNIPL